MIALYAALAIFRPAHKPIHYNIPSGRRKAGGVGIGVQRSRGARPHGPLQRYPGPAALQRNGASIAAGAARAAATISLRPGAL
jgi:hypothetical protein